MNQLKFRDGDKFITTTVEVESAIIDFADILAACEVVGDDLAEAPWDTWDGWEHTVQRLDDLDLSRDELRKSRGCCYDGREYVIIRLKTDDAWGTYGYLRAQGASKQVAAEAVAMAKREALKQLVEWYTNGWSWYGVTCEVNGVGASVWGIDDYDYADTYVRHEIASEVAHGLEKEGYTVVGYREPDAPTSDHRKTFARNLASQNWD